MPQQALQREDVHPVFQKVRCECVAESMHTHRFEDASPFSRFFHCPLNSFLAVTTVEITTTATIGFPSEEVVLRMLGGNISLQPPYQVNRKRNKAVFAPFSLNHMKCLDRKSVV